VCFSVLSLHAQPVRRSCYMHCAPRISCCDGFLPGLSVQVCGERTANNKLAWSGILLEGVFGSGGV